MKLKRKKPWILILGISIISCLCFSSCKVKPEISAEGFKAHTENGSGFTFDFSLPEEYVKSKPSEIPNLAFICNSCDYKTVCTYYVREDPRCFLSILASHVSEEMKVQYEDEDKERWLDSVIIPWYFFSLADVYPRVPLIEKEKDIDGNIFYKIYEITGYSHSDSTFGCWEPSIEDNRLPMDSVEACCYYYTIIGSYEIVVKYNNLCDFKSFSFEKIKNVLSSIRIKKDDSVVRCFGFAIRNSIL